MITPTTVRRPPPRNDRPLTDVAGRPAPADLDAETSINATLFAYPDRHYDISAWLLPEHFFGPRDGLVYGAIGQVIANQGSVDPVTVKAQLEANGTWASVGMDHLQYILTKGGINEPLIQRYAEIVVDKHRLRRTIALSQRITMEGYGAIESDVAWCDEVAVRFDALTGGKTQDTGGTARETVEAIFREWSATSTDAGVYLGTGIPEIDRLFRRMRPGQLIIIGAHSGIGKSALAACWATHVATQEIHCNQRSGVHIQSIEMTRAEYMERMVFGLARVDSYKLDDEHRNFVTPDEWAQVTLAAKQIGVDNIFIDDRPGITPSGIRASMKRTAARFARAGTPLRLGIVDYAQIVSGDVENKRRSDNREQEVSQVGRAMKELAKELGIPIILLAQLNEDSVRDGRKPRQGDLRESKALTMDADKVLLIWNPWYVERSAAYRNGEKVDALAREHVDFIIAKNRGARTGTVAATFYPSYVLFTSFNGTDEDLAALRNHQPTKPSRTSNRR